MFCVNIIVLFWQIVLLEAKLNEGAVDCRNLLYRHDRICWHTANSTARASAASIMLSGYMSINIAEFHINFTNFHNFLKLQNN